MDNKCNFCHSEQGSETGLFNGLSAQICGSCVALFFLAARPKRKWLGPWTLVHFAKEKTVR